jgi:hypothetical protein
MIVVRRLADHTLMKKKIPISLFLLLVLILFACRKEKEYFQDPETEPIIHTVKASSAIGYCSSLAMAVMSGESFPGVIASKSCSNYPCAALIFVDLGNEIHIPFTDDRNGNIVIAGLWTAVNEAILTLFFYDINISTSGFTLKNVHTFPVAEQNGNLMAVFAGMDINLGSNPLLPVELDLSEGEITFELDRLELDDPEDVYVAVEQHAYVISIEQNGTPGDLSDDSFSITGGGQIIEVVDNRGGIIQQALLDVLISNDCLANPKNGYALIKNTAAGGNSLPELGTAIFDFHSQCDGLVDITLATGVYIKANGKSIPLNFN